MKVNVEDGITQAFGVIKYISHEVAMEQMSKSGNAMRKGMRSALKSTNVESWTRVRNGKAYLEETDLRIYGQRESHTEDRGDAKGGRNMSNFINWILMEKTGTLVVGGVQPRHKPKKRRNGKVVGTLPAVGAVSKQAAAILHRMDTGKIIDGYDRNSQLAANIDHTNFMDRGRANAIGRVQHYLEQGYISIYRNAESNQNTKYTKRKWG